MKTVLTTFAISLSALCFADCKPEADCCIKSILEGKIPTENPRYRTLGRAMELIRERQLEVFVETASDRKQSANCLSDECFTLAMADWIKRNQGELSSARFNEGTVHNVDTPLRDNVKFIKLNKGDSVDVLKNFDQKIDFLYLDSLDFDAKNPNPSQNRALQEIEAAYPWLTKRSIVIVDHCESGQCGKGDLVIDFLVNRGWKILAKDSQVILSKE